MLQIMKGMVAAVIAVLLGACLCAQTSSGGERELSGAGATFPEPFYYNVFDSYYRQYGTRVNYRGDGSGAGMRGLMNKQIDFAGTDIGPGGQGHEDWGGEMARVPTCLGAVVVIYNLPENPKLRFAPDVLADIFLGKIARWNDPRMISINPEVKLPDLAISVVHRSDESGTTYIFTDYMGKTSTGWRNVMGAGKSSLAWPTGLGAKGNPGLAGMVRQVSGAIGYVELTYAVANNMTFGSILNKSGRFIDPSPATVMAAAAASAKWGNGIALTDTSVPDGYPISSFTWLVVFKEQCYGGRSRETAEELVRMLRFVTHEGQRYAPPLRYVPLPRKVVKGTDSILRLITYNGVPVMRKR
jgi:phosphate transport system substrate-binding protein